MQTEQTFYDKVYACWLGKNIGGTLGGPLEGRMELLDIKGYTQSFVEAVENDDLDLQLVNLHCVEQYGGRADMSLLSREWLDHVHFQFDEYGHSLTNMRRGLGSPLSGCFNNFFTDCMGSPIRSEIWAILCAGMPDLAAYYAYHDASVDHAGGEGVYGEIFFAVLESLAFVETDKLKLIDAALAYLPSTSQVRCCVELLLECYHSGKSWVEARQSIIDNFAGDNFTYAPVNIAFTLVGWLYAEGFTQQMLTTIDCGYDTDCTVATLGSLLGILYGSDYLDSCWTQPLGEKIIVSRPITGFDPPRTIAELAERTIAARKLVQAHYEQQPDKSVYAIPYQSAVERYHLPLGSAKKHCLTVELAHQSGIPVYAPGETRTLAVKLLNNQPLSQAVVVEVDLPGFTASPAVSLQLDADVPVTHTFVLTAPLEKRPLYRGSIAIRRYINGVYWNTDFVPLTLLPSMDWRVITDAGTSILHLPVNRIARADIALADSSSLALATQLFVPEPCTIALKFACHSPLRATIDGQLLFDSPDYTPVIPAYHRADPCKCASIVLDSGLHQLLLTLSRPADFSELFFFPLYPELNFSYVLDSLFLS